MNSIQAQVTKTEYINGGHLTIIVDGIRLDKWISIRLDDEEYLNLIPTWLGWLLDPKEQEYVWAKTQLCKRETTIVPILICPDDLDFSCTVIVCEIKYTNTTVQWMRMGIDKTDFPTYIGKDIEWFQNIPLLEFSLEQYETCVYTNLTIRN